MSLTCPHCRRPIARPAPKGCLTPRQKQALDFIRTTIAERGFPPSYSEIGAAIGVRSRGQVHSFVEALVERGHITRKPWRARGIALVEHAV